ncbi:hypothetical protein [Halorhabdus amylolytica]|uniref:hypothetical protein n=1 Tax=Halorhabdus amylolytica TaxID=2559573 RepID=UPI0010AAE242|nr:hypothetical protein [Halorhabdus amylolytica]
MSSYSPPDDDDEAESSFDPGVKSGEAIEDRGGFDWIAFHLDQSNYGLLLLLVLAMSLPAGLLTAGLVAYFFPEYAETAGKIVGWIGDLLADLFDLIR